MKTEQALSGTSAATYNVMESHLIEPGSISSNPLHPRGERNIVAGIEPEPAA